LIIVQLVGGLGNQLFQYAVGKRLAHVHNTILKLDLSAFEKYTLHAYHINNFNIKEDIATADDIAMVTNNDYFSSNVNRKPVVRERFFHFDPGILELPDNVWLIGYWQCEKYFLDIKETIIEEFSVRTRPDSRNQELADSIKSCNSVALHVRRGDYINNPHTNSVHGTCSLEYYQLCVAKLVEKVSDPHFIIFSDDPEWVTDNFGFLKYPVTFIDNNGPEKDYEDLRLMTICKHNIIANSTFSWWGAWLNPNPEKLVYAPAKWFNKEANTGDLIPASWFRV